MTTSAVATPPRATPPKTAAPNAATKSGSAAHTAALTVGVLDESSAGERRVALDPTAVERLTKAGRVVLVESGAGASATFGDSAYVAAGASVASRKQIIAKSDVIPVLRFPEPALAKALRAGQTLVGLIDPLNHLPGIAELAHRSVTRRRPRAAAPHAQQGAVDGCAQLPVECGRLPGRYRRGCGLHALPADDDQPASGTATPPKPS